MPLFYPILTASCMVCALFYVLRRRLKRIPADEPVVLVAVLGLLYLVIPCCMHWLSDGQYDLYSASQFNRHQPSARELAPLAWLYALFIIGLGIGALWFRLQVNNQSLVSSAPPDQLNRCVPSGVVVIGTFAATSGVVLLSSLTLGIDFNPSYDKSGIQTAATYHALPVGLQQWLHNLHSIQVVSQMAMLVWCFHTWTKPWRRTLVVIVVLWALFESTFSPGARTQLMMLLLSVVLLYHWYVRPLSSLQFACLAIIVFLCFMALGVVRGHGDILLGISAAKEHDINPFLVANEFQALFAGNYDLQTMVAGGSSPPSRIAFFDLYLLIPQQLLPFDKIDPQEWYVRSAETFGYFMFNPISQAIVGFGWFESLFRGLALGCILALIANKVDSHGHSFLWMMLRLYLAVWCYWIIRTTFGQVLYGFIYNFLPLTVLFLFASRRTAGSHIQGPSTKSSIRHKQNIPSPQAQ